jgi:hypothetical protein
MLLLRIFLILKFYIFMLQIFPLKNPPPQIVLQRPMTFEWAIEKAM